VGTILNPSLLVLGERVCRGCFCACRGFVSILFLHETWLKKYYASSLFRTNIQDGAVLHSDAGVPLTIGTGVTVGHRATLHGCTVGDYSLIGIGATVLNKAVIGKNCVIGAHALVSENKIIPDGSLVIGIEGKVVRTLTDDQIDALKAGADHYVRNQQWFKESLKVVVDEEDGNIQSML
jgi:carbonic anhydrase/acetyltransferase-like protein (isoleucine patch superfamily)